MLVDDIYAERFYACLMYIMGRGQSKIGHFFEWKRGTSTTLGSRRLSPSQFVGIHLTLLPSSDLLKSHIIEEKIKRSPPSSIRFFNEKKKIL